MKRLRTLLMVAAMAGGGVAAQFVAASPASAYGKAVYQITFSENCDNMSYCVGDNGPPGGAWGWAALYADHTGDLELTFCGHGGGGPGGAGAFHESVDIEQWSIDTANGVFFIDSSNPPNAEGDTPIPAAPGHYSLHPAPGISMEITVKQNPTS